MSLVTILLVFFLLIAFFNFLKYRDFNRRKLFIKKYVFSVGHFNEVKSKYPHLTTPNMHLVALALRKYFKYYLEHEFNVKYHSKNKEQLAMPSKVVDELWHAFILDTKAYSEFCQSAFGHYFHHVPSYKMVRAKSSEPPMRLTWRLACLDEGINALEPVRLPLVFAIDQKLQIPDGNHYLLHSAAIDDSSSSCGGSSGCSGFACGSGGMGGDSGGSCGSGCSGSGCGGGGCGGD